MNWETEQINLGPIKEKSRKEFTFLSKKKLDIVKIKPGCGSCTKVGEYNVETGELPVIYTPDKIPIHLLNQGKNKQDITKFIKVTYRDGKNEVLKFTATILKK